MSPRKDSGELTPAWVQAAPYPDGLVDEHALDELLTAAAGADARALLTAATRGITRLLGDRGSCILLEGQPRVALALHRPSISDMPIDLDRYPALVSSAERPVVQRSIKMLESALGSHRLPVDVWIDSHGLVRQFSLAFGECFSRTRVQYEMSLDLYDFGPQSTPSIPPNRSVYNLTPVISKAMRRANLGCVR